MESEDIAVTHHSQTLHERVAACYNLPFKTSCCRLELHYSCNLSHAVGGNLYVKLLKKNICDLDINKFTNFTQNSRNQTKVHLSLVVSDNSSKKSVSF